MYNPYVRQTARFEIDSEEWTNILVAILAISLSLTFYNAGLKVEPGHFLFLMAAYVLTVGSGFLLHELAHKYVAIRYGAHARFESWTVGLVIMLALAVIPSIFDIRLGLFLAPGAVMIYAMRPMTSKQAGLISVAGPLTNIALSVVFLGLSILAAPVEVLSAVLLMGAAVNMGLAWFNLIPLPPLDGFKVFTWDWKAWLLMFGFTTLTLGVIGGGLGF